MTIRIRCLLFVLIASAAASAQGVDPQLYAGLRWRLLGPLRGGKATMATGVPGNPAVYYFGTAGSGVWKTVDGGQVWTCVTDSIRLTSIGAVAVAASRPDTVYVGAGAGPTAGLYRSTDGGGHWDLVALQGHAVSSIVIDPKNPDIVMAAAGDSGVSRSTDGGRTWTSTLPDAQTGAVCWCSIPTIRTMFTPGHIRSRKADAGVRVADEVPRRSRRLRPTLRSIDRETKALRGPRPVPMDCPAGISEPSRSRSLRELKASAFTTTSRRGCSAPTMAARIGLAPPTIRV